VSASGYVLIECDVLRESANAFLLLVAGEEVWMPRSQVAPADLRGLEEGQEGVRLSVTAWVAREKGLAWQD
jgi:hypothetical protein